MENSIDSQLPLTEATFLVLLSLAAEPRHGYAIMKDVEALSEARIRFSTGTLYGVLKRLLEQGWIERFELENAPETERPQKHYQLSEYGQKILNAEARRLQSLVTMARLRLQSDAR